MSLKSDLSTALRRYDGRSQTILSEAAMRFRDRPGCMDALIDLACDEDRFISAGATWIMKAALDTGARLTEPQVTRLVDGLKGITAWQAQLHVCQAASHLRLPAGQNDRFRRWLTPLLDAQRPFLRAWALDALCHLGAADCEALLDRMADDTAASVRARVRNLRRALSADRD